MIHHLLIDAGDVVDALADELSFRVEVEELQGEFGPPDVSVSEVDEEYFDTLGNRAELLRQVKAYVIDGLSGPSDAAEEFIEDHTDSDPDEDCEGDEDEGDDDFDDGEIEDDDEDDFDANEDD